MTNPQASPDGTGTLLRDIFDFLGGVDGAVELRDRIIASERSAHPRRKWVPEWARQVCAALEEAAQRLHYSGDYFHDVGAQARAQVDWTASEAALRAIRDIPDVLLLQPAYLNPECRDDADEAPSHIPLRPEQQPGIATEISGPSTPRSGHYGTGTQTDEVMRAQALFTGNHEISTAAKNAASVLSAEIERLTRRVEELEKERDQLDATADAWKALASAAAPDERVLAEREACARIAERFAVAALKAPDPDDEWEEATAASSTAQSIANTIRARTPDQDTAP